MYAKKNVLFVKFFIANSIATGKVIDFFSGVVIRGGHVKSVSNPTKSGWKFDGWYIDTTNEKWNFSVSSVTEDVILEARWKSTK